MENKQPAPMLFDNIVAISWKSMVVMRTSRQKAFDVDSEHYNQ